MRTESTVAACQQQRRQKSRRAATGHDDVRRACGELLGARPAQPPPDKIQKSSQREGRNGARGRGGVVASAVTEMDGPRDLLIVVVDLLIACTVTCIIHALALLCWTPSFAL